MLLAPEQLASTLPAAPPEVAQVIAKHDARLGECLSRLGRKDAKPESALHAQLIDLNDDNWPDYFVLPVLPCNEEFMGAHAIAFWLLAGREGGGFTVVLEDAEDAVELLDSRTNGYRDVEVTYSVTIMRLRFNGKRYVGHTL